MEGLFVAITLAALVEALMGAHWGLGLGLFFVGMIASCFGAVTYPMWCGCCWEQDGEREGG